MDDDTTSCRICRTFVLQIPGWTTYIPSYWLLRAAWDPGRQFFEGPLHFSCLAQWEHREVFQQEVAGILTGPGRALTFEGTEFTMNQPGYFYGELLHQDADCAIYRHTTTDRWLMLTAQAAWETLGPRELHALSREDPARVESGVDRVALPEGSGPDIEFATLPELLDLLGSRDRYPSLLESGSPGYRSWGYYPRKRILEYSIDIDLPLPASAVDFLRGYAHSYAPLSFDDLD